MTKTPGSKRSEQALPSHGTRMDDSIRIGFKSLANLSGLPGILPDIERHINHDRRADNVISRNTTPEAAVIGIAAIVAHHKITFVRNCEGKLQVARLAAAKRIVFAELLTIDPDRAVVNVDSFARKTDDALDVVRL